MKKYLAPLIVVALLLLYDIAVVIAIVIFPIPWMLRILAILIPTVFAILLICVLVARIHEIQGGEENDSRKY